MKNLITLLLLCTFCSFISYGQFVENKGQVLDKNESFVPNVNFYYELDNTSLYFHNNKIVYSFIEKDELDETKYQDNFELLDSLKRNIGYTTYRIDMEFVDANENVEIIKGEKSDGDTHFYLNKRDGIRDVSTYKTITYKNIYDNIDIVFYQNKKGLKYDFILNEGADIEDIKVFYNGATDVSIKNGKVIIGTLYKTLEENIPLSYVDGDSKKEIDVSYEIDENKVLSFSTNSKSYNTLTIDPVLEWATYFNNTTVTTSSLDYANSHLDANGNYYIYGQVYSAANSYPVIDPGGSAYTASYNSSSDLYIAQFNANRSLIWSTYFGGSSGDNIYGSEVMASYGNTLHIVGERISQDAPFVNGGGFYVAPTNNNQALWARFNLTTGALNHLTGIGGLRAPSIEISASGNVGIIAHAYDFDNPFVLNRAGAYNQSVNGGFKDMFFMMFNSSHVQTWGTYLGGPASQEYFMFRFDNNNNIVFIGESSWLSGSTATSENLVQRPGAYYQSVGAGGQDVLLGMFNSSGSLIWNTLYGGDISDARRAQQGGYAKLLIDPSTQELLMFWNTTSTNLPVLNGGGGAYYKTVPTHANFNGSGSFWNYAAYFAKFTTGGALSHASYWYNSTAGDLIHDVTFGGCNKLYIAGRTDFATATTIPLSGGFNLSTGGQVIAMQMDRSTLNAEWSSSLSNNPAYGPTAAGRTDNPRVYFASEGYNDNGPTADPGGGAYYQANNVNGTSANFMIWQLHPTLPPDLTGTSPICAGQSTTLTASNGAGAPYNWYSSSTSSTVLNTGSTYTVSPSTTTTYYVSSGTGLCASPRSSITITVNPAPSAPSISSNSPICVGGALNLTSNTISGATYNWTGPNSFSSSLEDPTIPSATSAASGTYSCSVTVSGCSSASATTTVTLNTPSTAPTGISGTTAICSGGSTTLTVSGGSAGTGATAQWYQTSCGGTFINTGNSITVAPTSTTTYFVRYSGTCNTTTCTSQTVTVTAPPSAGTLSGNQNICDGSTTTFSSTQAGGSWSSSNTGIATANASSGVITGQSAGTATITYTVTGTGGCPNATATRTVTVTAPPSAGTLSGNQSICNGSTTTFSSTQAGGSWSSSNTGIATVNASSGVVTGQSAGTATITYTVTGTGGCSNATATRTVTVTAPPSAGTLSGNQTICDGLTTTFSSTQAGGSWSSSNTGVATVNASSGVVTGQSGGTATITYTVTGTGGCSNATATRTVTVNSNPTVTVPSGGNVCVGETLNLTPSTGGTWSSSDGTVATITNGGVVTGVDAGTADMTFTNTTTGCSSTVSAGTITVNPLPTFTVSTADPSSCGATDGTITISGLNASTGYEVSTGSGALSPVTSDPSGEIVLTFGAGSYSPIEVSWNGCSTIDNGTYDLNDPSSPSITVPNGGQLCEGETLNLTPSTGGTWTSNDPSVAIIDNAGLLSGVSAGTVTVTYTETATGCSSLASAGSITVNPIPTVTVPNGGNVCEGATLSLTPSTGGTWSSSDPSVATVTNGGIVTGVTVGTAEMTFTNTTTGCSSVASTGTITVNESPTIIVPVGNAICVGSTLDLAPTTGGTWSSSDPTVATITNGGVVTGVDQGTADMVFTSTTTGCSSIASTGTIIVNTTPTLTIGAIDCNELTSSYSVGYTTTTGATVTSDIGTVTSTAVTNVPNNETVIITATIAGCPSVSETVSTDECEEIVIDISNGVSPNNDGMNDFFEITSLEAYPENSLSIYNRWGDKVFQSSPYENEWVGQNNVGGIGGEELPAGTYFYILELGEDEEPMKGYIELKK